MSHALAAFACSFLLTAVIGAAEEAAAASPWPLDITIPNGVITLYQPQPEKLEGDVLTGRAAASFLPTGKGEDERVFGALWLTAKLDIDRENDVAKARELTITKVVTPKGEKTGDDGAAAKKLIQDTIVAKGLEIDLDRLIATLEDPQVDGRTDLNTKPPRILIRQEPTVLVVLDGEAQVRESGGVKRVVNSPSFIAIDGSGSYWLRGASDWLTAPALDGPWILPTTDPAKNLVEAAKAAGFPTTVMRGGDSKAPAVIVATEATELVVFDGKPSFETVGDGKLLAASNSATPALIDVASSTQWLLLAGRWYKAARLAEDATWELVTPDKLPETFSAIPEDGKWSDLRTHVAGTPEAEEALAMQQIPQTARIPRTATITVAYDGEPKWVRVEGRDAEYAENTADAVFRIAGPAYFVCRDAVWYEGKLPTGPFTVATSVPEALRKLPASCPWSNVSYVTVYETTTEYVCYGYTTGYLGWYGYYGCPVYGTGWPYHGYYGPIVVYPRPVTWGVGIAWHSSNGWGVVVAGGGAHWGIGVSGGSGWYGSGGGNTINIDRGDNNIGNGNGNLNRPAQRPAVYDRVAGAQRPKFEEAGNRLRQQPANTAAQRPARENLAVDRDGNIGRPTANGNWQVRDNGGWKDQAPAPKPVQRPEARPEPRPETKPVQRPETKPVQRPTQSFERTQQQRSRGEQRVQQRSAPARGGGGGARGGGGGRR